MKRGEVVDAETASRIVEKFRWIAGGNRKREIVESIRPVIWPEKKAPKINEMIELVDHVNLLERPCAKPLLHLICFPEQILMIGSIPNILPGDSYALFTHIGVCSYLGDLKTGFGWDLFFDSEEAKNKAMSNSQSANSWMAKEANIKFKWLRIHSLETIDFDGPGNNALTALLYVIALERFAFDYHSVSKLRPAFSKRSSPNTKMKEWPPIEIINLRLPEKKENPDAEGRELTIRFYVKGHFRRQWRPSTKDHKLIWIEEHIRGPKDAQLKPKPKIGRASCRDRVEIEVGVVAVLERRRNE